MPFAVQWRWAVVAAVALTGAASQAEVPVVVFDVPLTAECRDATPPGFREAYKRDVIEAVFKVSPQLLAGSERDLKRLHYEISTEQQMPVVGYLPNAEVTTDVVNGTIAIQNSSHHGEISFRYLILPAKGDGYLNGDLQSSHAEFGLLAPKQLLIAAGTIERGCGVYFELRQSSQDTLQKQREFACLFEVPASWRADAVTIRCNAKGTKRGLGGLTASDVGCGSSLLCVGLYRRNDGEARDYADALAKKQHAYLSRLAEQARKPKPAGLFASAAALDRLFSDGSRKAKLSKTTAIGAAVQSQIEEASLAAVSQEIKAAGPLKATVGDDDPLLAVPPDARIALDEMKAAKDELRRMNGRLNGN
jgi:hypothetical protein